jgi:hypothetical protein
VNRTARSSLVVALVVSLGVAACGGADKSVRVSARAAPEATTPSSSAPNDVSLATFVSRSSGLTDTDGRSVADLSSPGQMSSPTITPIAVPDPRDASVTYYNALVEGVPEIHVRDKSGDQVFANHAFSIAVRADGAVAYSDLDRAAAGLEIPYGHIVVAAPDGEIIRLMPESGQYTVLAWAGDLLLVGASINDSEALDIIAVDARGAARKLGTSAQLLALSPDGSLALLGGLTDDQFKLRLVDVATGDQVGAAVSRGPDGPLMPVVSATWSKDWLVLAGTVKGGSESALLRVSSAAASDGDFGAMDAFVLDPAKTTVPEDVWFSADGSSLYALAAPQVRTHDGVTRRLPRVLVLCSLGEATCTYHDLTVYTDSQLGRVRSPSRPAPVGLADNEAL